MFLSFVFISLFINVVVVVVFAPTIETKDAMIHLEFLTRVRVTILGKTKTDEIEKNAIS